MSTSAATRLVRFTKDQRKCLLGLRWLWRPNKQSPFEEQLLLPRQVDRLEEILPGCRALLRNPVIGKPATMTDIRDKLADVVKAISRAHRIVTSASAATREALTRLEIVRMQGVEARIELRNQAEPSAAIALADPLTEPDFVTGLLSLQKLAEAALQALPRQQRRANYATHLPIERIERALIRGFIDHHGSASQLPPYPLRVSVTERPFPDIAAIVYEAIGMNGLRGEPPERAIKAYLKLRRRRRSRAHPR